MKTLAIVLVSVVSAVVVTRLLAPAEPQAAAVTRGPAPPRFQPPAAPAPFERDAPTSSRPRPARPEPEPQEEAPPAKPPLSPPELRQAYLDGLSKMGYSGAPWTSKAKELIGGWEKDMGALGAGSQVLPVTCYKAACVLSAVATDADSAARFEENSRMRFREWHGARVALAAALDGGGRSTYTWVFFDPELADPPNFGVTN
jgi:hypothetical protein